MQISNASSNKGKTHAQHAQRQATEHSNNDRRNSSLNTNWQLAQIQPQLEVTMLGFIREASFLFLFVFLVTCCFTRGNRDQDM